METERLQPEEIERAAQFIREGELVAFQTETVYGLGADATNDEAVKKIYQAKGRPSDNPLIVHVSSKDQVKQYVEEIPPEAVRLMDAFWPGPLTIILKHKKGTLSETVTAGLDTVGIRVPDSSSALKLIETAGKPLAAPSANTSGRPSPTTAEHVYHDMEGKIAAIVDDGETGVGLESTVLDLTDRNQPTILRPGGLSKKELERIIGPVALDPYLSSQAQAPKSPGMKYRHYSPEEPVYIVSESGHGWNKVIEYFEAQNEKIGLLASEDIIQTYGKHAVATFSLGRKEDTQTASRLLYAGLRFFETTDATIILAEAYEESDEGYAFMNRLEKAAAGNYL